MEKSTQKVAGLYYRTVAEDEGTIHLIDSWEDFRLAEERNQSDEHLIGFINSDLLFSYDGCFLYAKDTDRALTANEMYNQLVGGIANRSAVNEFIEKLLPSNAHISDSLNHSDFSIQDIYFESVLSLGEEAVFASEYLADDNNFKQTDFCIAFNDLEADEPRSAKDVIAYAKRRVEANIDEFCHIPECKIESMTIGQAIAIIHSFGEKAIGFYRNKAIEDIVNNYLSGKEDEVIESIHDNMLFNGEIQNYINELSELYNEYDVDFGLDDFPVFKQELVRFAMCEHVEDLIMNGNKKDAGIFMVDHNMTLSELNTERFDYPMSDISIVSEYMLEYAVSEVKAKNAEKRESNAFGADKTSLHQKP